MFAWFGHGHLSVKSLTSGNDSSSSSLDRIVGCKRLFEIEVIRDVAHQLLCFITVIRSDYRGCVNGFVKNLFPALQGRYPVPSSSRRRHRDRTFAPRNTKASDALSLA
jgi:hypothetical protein